ncbi:MAG: hypothetical protein HC828_09045 [Blastochloris sp.]|nr:hypothetical protein [Blastochloris sp.]
MTPVTGSQYCGILSPLSPLAHRHVCLSHKLLHKTGWGNERRFNRDSTTGDSGDSGDIDLSITPFTLHSTVNDLSNALLISFLFFFTWMDERRNYGQFP